MHTPKWGVVAQTLLPILLVAGLVVLIIFTTRLG